MDRTFAAAYRGKTRARVAAIYAILAAFNVTAWTALVLTSHRYALLLPLGVTAFVLGLRHAVDADHIAAIDATTRKLMHSGARPAGVGFFFSLGHSTIVFVLSVLVAILGVTLKRHFPALQSVGVIGTSVSALFLLGIGAANAVVLLEILRRKGSESPGDFLAGGGFLTRLLRPALGLVTKSWHMYPVGILFGLGFDTATEIALLGIASASSASGMPVAYILILPCLFAAGMSLVDTTEAIAMLGAYGWAYVRPSRKFAYNVNMTLISTSISLILGIAQALAVLGIVSADRWLSSPNLNYGVLALFVVTPAATVWLARPHLRR